MRKGFGLITYLLLGAGMTYSANAEDINRDALVNNGTSVSEAVVGVGEALLDGVTGTFQGLRDDVDRGRYLAMPLSVVDGAAGLVRGIVDSGLGLVAESANAITDVGEGATNAVLTLGTRVVQTNEYGVRSDASVADYLNLVKGGSPNFDSPTLRPARDVWDVGCDAAAELVNAVVPNDVRNPVDYALAPARVVEVAFDAVEGSGNSVMQIGADANSAVEDAAVSTTRDLEELMYGD